MLCREKKDSFCCMVESRFVCERKKRFVLGGWSTLEVF